MAMEEIIAARCSDLDHMCVVRVIGFSKLGRQLLPISKPLYQSQWKWKAATTTTTSANRRYYGGGRRHDRR